MKIKFFEKKEVFCINLNYLEEIETGETPKTPEISFKEESKDNEILKNYNIPYSLFNKKESNNVIVKLTNKMKIQIFINGIEIFIPSNILEFQNKTEKNDIESIKLFEGFYGICSTIMIYRNDPKNILQDIYPKYLMETQNKTNNLIQKYYQNGLFKEELLIPFIRADLKNNVVEKNIYDATLKNLADQNLSELSKFIENNLVSIYIPTRTHINSELKTRIEDSRQIDEEIRATILVDSINNFNVVLKNNNLYPNLMYSINGGVHILSNIFYDFSFDIGGINHFLPLIEVMTDYNELLTNGNLEIFMNIILYLFSNHKKLLINEEDTKFFYYLSLFLEKIPEKFYTDVSVHIKSILITLQSLENEITNNEVNIFNTYKKEFFNNVCMNEKILFRFNFKDKSLMYEQIYKFLIQQAAENKKIEINIMNIINILLFHEKERYTHFCCKKHAAYFNKESKIMIE